MIRKYEGHPILLNLGQLYDECKREFQELLSILDRTKIICPDCGTKMNRDITCPNCSFTLNPVKKEVFVTKNH
jgi:rubrerythrin